MEKDSFVRQDYRMKSCDVTLVHVGFKVIDGFYLLLDNHLFLSLKLEHTKLP